MVYNLAHGVLATSTRTWVGTLRSNASAVCGTVAVNDTFRSTAFVGISKEVWGTGAGCCVIILTANCICTAG